MAGTMKVNGRVSLKEGKYDNGFNPSSINLVDAEFFEQVIDPYTEESLSLGSSDQAFFVNMSPEFDLQIGLVVAATFYPFAVIPAGGYASCPIDPGISYYALAQSNYGRLFVYHGTRVA